MYQQNTISFNASKLVNAPEHIESIASHGECCLTTFTRTVECAALWPENRFEIRAGWEKSTQELADLTSRVEVEVGPGFWEWNGTENATRNTNKKHQASCRRQCVIAKCLVILAKNWLWNPLYVGLAVTAFTTFDRRLSGEICVVVVVSLLCLFVATSTRSHYFDLFSLLIALTMFLQ